MSRLDQKPMETRDMTEIRELETAAGFDGHASTWWTVDTYGTAWKPGAFQKSIDQRGTRVPVLWSHDPTKPIGRLSQLREDSHGLRFTANIVEKTQAGAEIMALLREDVPLGMSFGFKTLQERAPKESEWARLKYADDTDYFQSDEGKHRIRIKTETALWEVSATTFPANTAAAITAVRTGMNVLTLQSMIDAVRSGNADPQLMEQIAELAKIWKQRRQRDRNIEVALAEGGLLLGRWSA